MFGEMKTSALLLATIALACGGTRDIDRSAPIAHVRLHAEGTAVVPGATPPFGGISGIDLTPDGTWYLISDDRAARGPARFYVGSIRLDGRRGVSLHLERVDTMRDVGGAMYAESTIDPEAIRYDPMNRTLWWTSEGDERQRIDPFIREMRLDGTHAREVPLPAMFRMNDSPTSGPRNNSVFEGLALSADGTRVIVSTEGVLKQDGPEVTHRVQRPIRISFYDRASMRLVRQIAYVPEPAPTPAADTVATENGVVEILARDGTHLLVLERGYTPGSLPQVRLFEADISTASDITSIDRLEGSEYRPASKRLIADFESLGLAGLDNVEAMSWGEPLATGERTLVFMSDDNFSRLQFTQIIVLAVE
jgi:hypothetical protein